MVRLGSVTARRVRALLSFSLLACTIPVLTTTSGCGDAAVSERSLGLSMPEILGAKAISAHYVEVALAGPTNEAALLPGNYVIEEVDGDSLTINEVMAAGSPRRVWLVTDPQRADAIYKIAANTTETAGGENGGAADGGAADGGAANGGAGQTLFFGGSGFEEPSLLSAVALDNTTILLSFSGLLNKPTAEMTVHYRVLDESGNPNVDIAVVDANLEDNGTSVILTTTPQSNQTYQIQVDNVGSAFPATSTCSGEQISFEGGSTSVCAPEIRPNNIDGFTAPFVLTARTKVDDTATEDADAAGDEARPYLWTGGLGVFRTTCSGSSTISGSSSDRDEEVMIAFDVPVQKEALTIAFSDLNFASDSPALFFSDDTSDGFDHFASKTEIQSAFTVTSNNRGTVVVGLLDSVPEFTMIDAIKYRETSSASLLGGLCLNRSLPLNPTANRATFFGIAPDDSTGPDLVAAVPTDVSTIVLSFSEPLADDAGDTGNYDVSPFLPVIAAELSEFKNQVILTVLPMTDGETYTVTVSGVRDRMLPGGNLITANNSDSFVYDAASAGGAPGSANEPPRVVGALSTSSNSVLVSFNKSMDDSAEDPANYFITRELSATDSARLLVTGAVFANSDRKSVELTTLAQEEVVYRVSVNSVQDLQGNALAPEEILVDPTSTTFVGTPPSCPRCVNGSGGIDGTGFCLTDDDCDDDAPCNANESDCEDQCLTDCDLVDTDNDGLPDHIEQRGWTVTVELTARDGLLEIRQQQRRQVTSNPLVADTDGDGLDDLTERELSTDPREADTDGDLLSDEREFNFFFSTPTDQDSDNDEIDDYLEVAFYKTSPILADTDGDGLDDDVELLDLNRDARQADLPEFEIDIDEIRLQIDERYTYTDATGETVTETSNTSTTLTQSNETSQSRSDVETWRIGGEIGFKGGTEGGKPVAVGDFRVTGGYENVTQIDEGSTRASQEAYETSLSRGREFVTTREVTREIFGASVEVPLSIRLTGDIAFTLSNLEVSVLQQGRERTKLIPIATLIPSSTLATGQTAEFNLGPLVPERGPIILGNSEIFPSLVENLLREPRGPIIIPSNFDVTDEFGRNFAFQSQEIVDRTAALIIDFGDGTVERYRVAVNGGIDDLGVAGPAGEFVGGYDERGLPIGIPMDYALQDILGFEKNPTTNDAILAGPDGVAESFASGDDVQEVPPSTTGLDDARVIISAGENGVLDSVPNNASDDFTAITRGYETSATCNENTSPAIIEPLADGNGVADTTAVGDDIQEIAVGNAVSAGDVVVSAGTNGVLDTVQNGDDISYGPGTICSVDSDCDGGQCNGTKVIKRFKNSLTGDRNRFWAVLTSEQVPVGTDFGAVTLKPRTVIFLAFEQDIDRDGIGVREEYSYGSNDRLKDTDGDNLGDFTEIRDGWSVVVAGDEGFTAYPDPRLADSDFDGVCDDVEKLCGTDPRKRDTDGDGISDFDELNDDNDDSTTLSAESSDCDQDDQTPNDCPAWITDAANCYFAGRCSLNSSPPFPPSDLDPLNPDSDGDGLLDGIELELDADPLDPNDAGDFLDSDEDGLTDKEEGITGWEVEVELCSNTCNNAFNGTCNNGCDDGTDCADCGPVTVTRTVYSDPLNGDTDFDGLPDFLERTLALDPDTPDTDGDGLLDFDEFNGFGFYIPLNFVYPGFFLTDAGSQQIGTDPASQDTDGDRLSDNFERLGGWPVLSVVDNAARNVLSSPLFEDTDVDGLTDLEEFLGQDEDPPGDSSDSGDATDPTDPDTDDDGKLDSEETESDPLVPDVFVTVSIDRIFDINGPEDGGNDDNEWLFFIRIVRPLQNRSNTLFDDQDWCESVSGVSCEENDCTEFARTGDWTSISTGGQSISFGLPLGDPFVIESEFAEIDGCSGNAINVTCDKNFQQIVTSDSLVNSGGYSIITIEYSGGGCNAKFPIEIEAQ
ncbi:MAG: hypothetical protein ACPGXK_01840 [Phycisphaerae bacterium]